MSAVDPVDIDALIRICSDQKKPIGIRGESAIVLGKLRARQAVDVLVKNLWEDQPDLAIWSGTALEDIRSRTATEPLLRVLRDCPFPASREAAAKVFKRLKDPKAIRVLKEVFLNTQERPYVRFQAGAALAEWKASRFVEVLLKCSSDESAEVRFVSVYGLGLSGDRRALPVLRRLTADNEVAVAHTTVGEEALDALETFARRRKRRRFRTC